MYNPSAFAENFRNMFDMNQFTNTYRRNVETVTAISQSIMEGAQAMARRQTELTQSNAQTLMSATRDMMSNTSAPETNISRQANLAKTMMECTLNNVREITEMATKCNVEAFSKLQERASESLEELSNAGAKAANTAQRKSA